MTSSAVPRYSALLWPTLRAVIALGGSGTIDEINQKVIEQEQYSEPMQEVLHGDGPGTEIAYRLAWSRTYLKKMGALTNSERGVWTSTGAGRALDEAQILRLHTQYLSERNRARRALRETPPLIDESDGGDPSEAEEDVEPHWKDQALDVLLQLPSDGFERLARRLLREAGFISATVTGRSGDGGIDGVGVYRLSLVSFPVFFQCKRYRGSVGSSAVRDFRGAMAGRGDKGLLITTGTFANDAKAEATRDGAPPIDLIDGDRLCDLLRSTGSA